MKLFLVGATGRTGRLVLTKALSRGHSVTAFVRDKSELTSAGPLTIVEGDALSATDLARAIPGHDAVVSILGRRSEADTHLLETGARAMLDALPAAGVERYVTVSQGLLFPSRNPVVGLLRHLLRTAVADSTAMEGLIRQSDLNWTIVRPPRLKDGQRPHGYRACADARPARAFSMERSDLAAFLLDEVEQSRFNRTIVGVG